MAQLTVQYEDLRDFITQISVLGMLREVRGANPISEIGGITEVAAALPDCPAVLFDEIVGCRPGFRILTNATVSPQRAAFALGIDPALSPLAALLAWKGRRGNLVFHRPRQVSQASFLENSKSGSDVDISQFPAPLWHARDGGPFIGTGSIVVVRDPNSDWINASVYRVQVHGPNRVTVQFDHQGRHGAIIARKYWERGQPCPIAIVSGCDPSLFVSGFEYLPEGVSEYEFAGAIKGHPIDVIPGPQSGLLVPKNAEMVFEGNLLPMDKVSLEEGPFGEFTGYYATEKRPAPVMQIDAIHWRNDPILLASPPMKPPRFHFGLPLRAASIWANLETDGVTDVVGAWQHVAQLMTVIALKQRYAGHAKRAGLIAAAQSYMGRIIVTVDEDVDPSDLADVMWAIANSVRTVGAS